MIIYYGGSLNKPMVKAIQDVVPAVMFSYANMDEKLRLRISEREHFMSIVKYRRRKR